LFLFIVAVMALW